MNGVWIVVIVGAVLVLGVVLFFLFLTTPLRQGGVGYPCRGHGECRSGLLCDNGTCKVPVGGMCNSLAECSGSAKECRKDRTGRSGGVCSDRATGTVGDECPCVDGLVCERGICHTVISHVAPPLPVPVVGPVDAAKDDWGDTRVTPATTITDQMGTPVYDGAIDIAGSAPYVLYSDGRVMAGGTTLPPAQLSRILWYGGGLYGVQDNRLVVLSNRKWQPVSWAPTGILNANTTTTGSHLWVRTPDKEYLFTQGSSPRSWATQGNDKVFGRDENNYLEIRPNYTALRYPGGKLIDDIRTGAILPDDRIARIRASSDSKITAIRMAGGKDYYVVSGD